MALSKYTYEGAGTVQNRLTACPLCGHTFSDHEPRWKHFLDEHRPADCEGVTPQGERPAAASEPLFADPDPDSDDRLVTDGGTASFGPRLADAKRIGEDIEFDVITALDALDYANDSQAHHDAVTTGVLAPGTTPDWVVFVGTPLVAADTQVEIKACRRRQSNGDRTTPGRVTLKGREEGQHAALLDAAGVYILTVYESTEAAQRDARRLLAAIIIPATLVDELTTDSWYPVDRAEKTHARLAWPTVTNTLPGGDSA